MEFVSLIPNMDKDLAIAIVNQFPAYTEFATTAITVLKDMCDSVLEKGETSHMETLAAYRKLLDDLGEMAKRDNITEEERKFLTEQMIIVADKIGEKDTEFKNFISGVLKYGTTILGGAIIIGAAILGVNIKGKDIPILNRFAIGLQREEKYISLCSYFSKRVLFKSIYPLSKSLIEERISL